MVVTKLMNLEFMLTGLKVFPVMHYTEKLSYLLSFCIARKVFNIDARNEIA